MARLSLTLRNDVSEIVRLVESLERFGQEAGLHDEVAFRVTLALDEIVSNVIRHGFEDGGEHPITVTVDVTGGTITATVVDDGRPFDPLQAPPPDLDVPLAVRKPGGLGIHLVKTTMDDVVYTRDGTRNVLTMRTSVASRE